MGQHVLSAMFLSDLIATNILYLFGNFHLLSRLHYCAIHLIWKMQPTRYSFPSQNQLCPRDFQSRELVLNLHLKCISAMASAVVPQCCCSRMSSALKPCLFQSSLFAFMGYATFQQIRYSLTRNVFQMNGPYITSLPNQSTT